MNYDEKRRKQIALREKLTRIQAEAERKRQQAAKKKR